MDGDDFLSSPMSKGLHVSTPQPREGAQAPTRGEMPSKRTLEMGGAALPVPVVDRTTASGELQRFHRSDPEDDSEEEEEEDDSFTCTPFCGVGLLDPLSSPGDSVLSESIASPDPGTHLGDATPFPSSVPAGRSAAGKVFSLGRADRSNTEEMLRFELASPSPFVDDGAKSTGSLSPFMVAGVPLPPPSTSVPPPVKAAMSPCVSGKRSRAASSPGWEPDLTRSKSANFDLRIDTSACERVFGFPSSATPLSNAPLAESHHSNDSSDDEHTENAFPTSQLLPSTGFQDEHRVIEPNTVRTPMDPVALCAIPAR